MQTMQTMQTMQRSPFVYAMFRDEKVAARAVRGLIDAGFPTRDVSALLRGDRRLQELPLEHRTGMERGAALGGVIGTLSGVVLAGGGLMFTGPALALPGAIAGGALGMLAGTLAGLAHWNDRIAFPQNAFARGAVLVGVTTHEGRASLAREVLRRMGGGRPLVSSRGEAKQTVRGQRQPSPAEPAPQRSGPQGGIR